LDQSAFELFDDLSAQVLIQIVGHLFDIDFLTDCNAAISCPYASASTEDTKTAEAVSSCEKAW
jgi:hypothetical protein